MVYNPHDDQIYYLAPDGLYSVNQDMQATRRISYGIGRVSEKKIKIDNGLCAVTSNLTVAKLFRLLDGAQITYEPLYIEQKLNLLNGVLESFFCGVRVRVNGNEFLSFTNKLYYNNNLLVEFEDQWIL